ncbi:hypothetical protein GGD66_002591 [Bradyrhizobium sp. CIR48]|nr:hypothetical protein [Bradyrhizobium sp. CIR48]
MSLRHRCCPSGGAPLTLQSRSPRHDNLASARTDACLLFASATRFSAHISIFFSRVRARSFRVISQYFSAEKTTIGSSRLLMICQAIDGPRSTASIALPRAGNLTLRKILSLHANLDRGVDRSPTAIATITTGRRLILGRAHSSRSKISRRSPLQVIYSPFSVCIVVAIQGRHSLDVENVHRSQSSRI